jgi:hypothetical protein
VAQANRVPRLTTQTHVPLMRLFPVDSARRTVGAHLIGDMDAECTYATHVVDLMKTTLVPGATMEIHSLKSRHQTHKNTRILIEGEAGGFRPTFYKRKCRRIGLSCFKHVEICQITTGSLRHHISLHLLNPRNVGGVPYLNNTELACLNVALNLARIMPDLTMHYRTMSDKEKCLYRKVVDVMPPFEASSGTKVDKKVVSDSMTAVEGNVAQDFMTIFSDALDLLSEVDRHPTEEHRLLWLPRLTKNFTGSAAIQGVVALNGIPPAAMEFRTLSIWSSRAVGTKSSFSDKVSCAVKMNQPDQLKQAMCQQADDIMVSTRKLFTQVPEDERLRELIYTIDIAHEFSPDTYGNSFVGSGQQINRYMKECMKMRILEHTDHHSQLGKLLDVMETQALARC